MNMSRTLVASQIQCALFSLSMLSLVYGCTSRVSNDGADFQSIDSSQARAPADEDGIQTKLRMTRFPGSVIHEADNKQPLFLKKTIDSIVGSNEAGAVLEIMQGNDGDLPRLGRPSEGFNSAIGAESYLNRRKSEELTSEKQSSSRPQVSNEELTDLKKKWLLLTSFGGPQGLFQTARHVKEYFRLRVKDLKARRPVTELPSQVVQGALEQMGYWSRPPVAAGAGLLELQSAGEKVFDRNRALLLLDLSSKIQGAGVTQFQKLDQFLASLQDTQANSRLLWVRTHIIVHPPEQNDWFFALGPFSLLSYSFAHISNLTSSSFTFTMVTYNFLFGVHSWTKAETTSLLDNWCVKPTRKEPLYESTCESILEFQTKTKQSSLGLLADRGLATEFEVKGYSPVYLHQETIQKAALNPELFKQLQDFVSHFSL